MNRYTWRTGVLEIFMILAAAVYIFPLFILINVSLRPESEIGNPLVPTSQPTLDNYADAWSRAGLGSAMISSAVIAVGSVAVLIVVSSLAAYALARVTSRLSGFLFWLLIGGLLLPFQVAMIPLYMTMRDLGLLGSVWGLILFYAGSITPLSIFLYAGFIRALPLDYEEAAWLDGATALRTFRSVVFPLLRPVTGTVIIINAIAIWNDLFTPLLYLSGSGQQTIPVAIQMFVGQNSTNWSLVFAGLVMGIAPILIVFFILQKSVIKGFASGLKG